MFIDLTLKQEQKEYQDEGMQVCFSYFTFKIEILVEGYQSKVIFNHSQLMRKYFDNQIVCDLIEGGNPPGLFRLLDDTCKTVHSLDSATCDAKFMEKVHKGLQSHPHLVIHDMNSFTIKHYAGFFIFIEDSFSKVMFNMMWKSLPSKTMTIYIHLWLCVCRHPAMLFIGVYSLKMLQIKNKVLQLQE